MGINANFTVNCWSCGQVKNISPSSKRSRNYCNRECYRDAQKQKIYNQHLKKRINVSCTNCKTEFEVVNARKDKAKFCSIACKAKATFGVGPEHHQWKGDKAGYGALHSWARRHKGAPESCGICKHDGSKHRLEIANISGKYLRDLNDWVYLCAKCHKRYDNVSNKGWVTRRANIHR